MKNERLGCFTTSGLMSAVLTILIVVAFAFVKGGMLFNPGSLNAQTGSSLGGVSSHAEIAGQCDYCHVPFWGVSKMADRCVTCHTDVAVQWQDPSTLHGVLFKDNPNLACRNCHPDHRGPQASLTDLSNAHFPHNSYGFSLTSHQTRSEDSSISCTDCHSHDYNSFDQAVCITCHNQEDAAFLNSHLKDFSDDCLACHDGLDSLGHDFDHDKVTFQLTGKHAGVSCADCHANARTKVDLVSTPQDCNSCHADKDPHKSRYGIDCGTCHTTSGWTPASFDHNLSTFRLDGKHINVPCEECHSDHVFVGTPSDCLSCHKEKDVHMGSLGVDCAGCHNSGGWKPSTYNHNLSIFKLTGKHFTTECAGCHINNLFKGTPIECFACHQKDDTHNGQYGSNCGTCHTSIAWKPATFDHNLSAFKLDGRHSTAVCLSCHVNNIFKGTPTDCNSCHRKDDFHNNQYGSGCGNCHTTSAWKPATFDHNLSAFKLTGKHAITTCQSCHFNNIFKGTPTDCNSCHREDDFHNGQFGLGCANCHSTSAWKPATFDHNLSTFKLTGKHASTACASCHVNNVYKGTPSDCFSCHRNDDNHSGRYGTNCGSCHSTSAWKPATFDHNLATFKLTGKHATVACENCHINNVYQGTPSDCYSCHKNDDNHNGQFGSDCETCHTTSGWTPATFDHNRSNFPLTGAHTNLSCSQCHSGGGYGGLSTDCVSCHAQPNTHAGLSTDCTQCHSTSNWDANFAHPGGCDGNCANHEKASCADCHPANYSTYTCLKCHDSNNPDD